MSGDTALDALVADYLPDPAIPDEMIGPDGGVRDHWRSFLRGYAALGHDTRAEIAATQTERLLETGIAFNVQADPTDQRFSWRLDPLPLLISADEWAGLERGLVQRARMIDAVLRDIYGAQRLLRDGSLPPGLVLGSADYVHAAAGWQKQPDRCLMIYACDLVRTADRGWQVLADQVDAPSGHGWLLASRVSQANAMGDLYLGAQVRRVAGYFAAMKDMFTGAAGDNGRIAVLSPGPEDPGYFSHAYLARYLGLPVVESADLSHREGKLHVKTLEGLMRVELLIRKQRSAAIDSLSIPGVAGLGTPGLLQAARSGSLQVANAVGSGVLQNRALANHAQGLCETLLGERQILPDCPALWLGDPDAIDRFMAEPGWRIGRLTGQNDPGAACREDPLANLASPDQRRAFLKRSGFRYIAEKPAPLPTTPAIRDGKLQPAHWAMRAFVSLDEHGSYQVLPGALVRLADQPSSLGLPNGCGSKDLWVLDRAGGPSAASLINQRMRTVHLQRTGRDLLSRTAENLYWLGRYVERAETVLRVMSAVFSRVIDDGGINGRTALFERLVGVHHEQSDAEQTSDLATALRALMDDPGQTYSMVNSLAGIARNAALTQSILSRDGWRVLQALHTDPRWKIDRARLHQAPPTALINESIQRLSAFSGTSVENMTRNYAWRFLEIGRRLERAVQTSLLAQDLIINSDRMIDAASALTALLEIGDSTMTYRSRYVTVPMAAPTIDLLILDETNPRSLAFQLASLDQIMAELPGDGPYRRSEHRLVLARLTELRLQNADALASPHPDDGSQPADLLHDLLRAVQESMREASDLIAQSYFVIADTPMTSYSLKSTVSP